MPSEDIILNEVRFRGTPTINFALWLGLRNMHHAPRSLKPNDTRVERFSGVSVAGLWSGRISRSGTEGTTQARYLGHDCSHKSVKHTVHTLRQKSLCRRMLVEWRGFTTGQYRWLSGGDRSRYGADLPCLAMRTGPNVRRCFALGGNKRNLCLHLSPFFFTIM